MKEIVIRLSKDGKISMSVAGVKGGLCKDLTKSLENALGTTEQTQITGEYYEQQPIEDQQTENN